MGSGPDVMRLEITDKSSNVQFVEIRMTPGDLMLAMTGRMIDCQMDLRGLHLVGMLSETKRELVPVDKFELRRAADRAGLDDAERSPSVDAVLAPFEVDGWKGYVSDLFNGHCYVSDKELGDCQKVTFHRHVNPKTGLPVTT